MKSTRYYIWALLLILTCFSVLSAHAKSKIISPDSTIQALQKHKHLSEPDKAAIMSAVVPGLGQAGHHDSWWHVPIIYAGFAVMGYSIYYNNTLYNTYRIAYRNSVREDGGYDENLLENRELYRRNRDLTIIVACVWYLANIMDAYTSAHLREFDISNNLALKLDPLNISMFGNQPVVTCGLKLNLR